MGGGHQKVRSLKTTTILWRLDTEAIWTGGEAGPVTETSPDLHHQLMMSYEEHH